MVLLKRTLENGFNGHHSPPIPRAPRSVRRRGLPQKSPEGGGICAFELLATVAGKLLEESECSSASSSAAVGFGQCGIDKDAIKEPQDVDKPLGGEHDEQGSSEGSVFFSGLQRDICKKKLEHVGGAIDDHASVKVDSDSKLMIQKNDCEFVKLTGGGLKHIYHKKRSSYDMDRSQRNTPFKKRKLFDRSSVVTYDGGISCESVCNSPEKSIENDKNAPARKLNEGNGMTSSAFGRQKSCSLRNSHVRLSIKSFKVPELFIEVPESTTIGSLKRTVLEAVTTILGGGLHVGVLLDGKKIRDDKRTLLKTGISQNVEMDSIGFMLEPDSPTQPSQPICSEDPPIPLPGDSMKFVNRSQVNPNEDMFLLDPPDKPSMTDSNSPAGSSGYLVPCPTTELVDKNNSDSKALVPVPEASMEAVAVMPLNQRPKRSEIGQRRARRPFSVLEVEALVQAVEKLGTGRWRDVKLCAFKNAKHRTYVDLKDKWKTLVHTARISPQQRRGEPVPQELLDRVLAAQAYWSDHQAKQHGKQQQAVIPKLTNSAVAVKA